VLQLAPPPAVIAHPQLRQHQQQPCPHNPHLSAKRPPVVPKWLQEGWRGIQAGVLTRC
jgi:hypothetical protein